MAYFLKRCPTRVEELNNLCREQQEVLEFYKNVRSLAKKVCSTNATEIRSQ